MDEDVQITRQIRGCEDKACPAVWETTDPELVAVRGDYHPAPEGTEPGEQVILVPRAMLANISR